jgi:hypothetical protein
MLKRTTVHGARKWKIVGKPIAESEATVRELILTENFPKQELSADSQWKNL